MGKTALLLGMVYSNEKDPITGQMFRDRVRCEAMEKLGYVVKTLDDKHDGDLERVRDVFTLDRMFYPFYAPEYFFLVISRQPSLLIALIVLRIKCRRI